MLTVTVISDEPLVEAGLRAVLCREFELTRSTEAEAQAPAELAELAPNIILWVLRRDAGLTLTDLRYFNPGSFIVLVAPSFSPEFAHRALESGVRGFIRTTATPEELSECVRAVGRGELWMEKTLSMQLLDSRPVRLSQRQREIIQLLVQGLKNKEIASALGIAEGTVKAYLTVLFEKVGAKDRFELALFGLKNLTGLSEERAVVPRIAVRAQSLAPRRQRRSMLG